MANEQKDRKEQYKRYRLEHQEQIKEYNAERYRLYKDEILAHQKQYRKENKELLSERAKQYRETSNYKERKKAWRQEKIICELCGSSVSRNNIAAHRESKKCKCKQVDPKQ